jgi:GH25 family lysozyme M1 (1,4-beta-N-acetylmuramidase)
VFTAEFIVSSRAPYLEDQLALFKRAPHPVRTPRLKALSVAALVAGAVTLGAQPVSAKTNPITHPERDWMGSQIAKHEGASRDDKMVIKLASTQTPGLDVSAWEGTSIDWNGLYAQGARFAYVKSTEGTSYFSPDFWNQYGGAYYAGIIHAAYHFALPNASAGYVQADYLLNHGGRWSPDGMTLPAGLDMEWNPYSGGDCYGLSQSQMVNWIWSFIDEYYASEGVYPVIYTGKTWWTECTGNLGNFASYTPLWIASRTGSPGAMPTNWGYQTIWQWAFDGQFPGDQDVFNGDESALDSFAYYGY